MYCKPRPNFCKLPTQTQVMPAKVAPTNHNIVEKTCEYIVPEVYPTHTHNVTNHVYKHVKSYPHTVSQSQQIAHQQFVDPTPGPQVAGAMSPGFGGPGMTSPGFGGPQVGGAMTPGYGGPQVGGAMTPGYGGPQVAGAMMPGHGLGHKHHKGCGCKY